MAPDQKHFCCPGNGIINNVIHNAVMMG